MKSNLLMQKIVNKIPISFLRYLAYSRIGSRLVKNLKEKKFGDKIIVDLDDSIKIYSDLFSPRELQSGASYEVKIKKMFLENISQGSIVIDCGAKIGEFSLIAAKKVGTKGKVIAIEPFRRTVNRLQENFILNKFNNYKILKLAVSNKPGIETFYENPISGEGCLDPSLFEGKNLDANEVKLDTLDNIISNQNLERVDMIKIDVEGFEYEVLSGCIKSFKLNKIQKILCEIHHEFLRKKGINEKTIYDLLENNGFTVKFIDNSHILAKKI